MTVNFFLICFGVLGCYAALRTIRRGWLRVLIVFFLIVCLIKIGFDQMFPLPVYVTQQQQPASSPSFGFDAVRTYIARTTLDLEDDRCIMSHLEDTPLGPVAYALELHKFLRDYQPGQGVGGGGKRGSMQQVMSNTLGSPGYTAQTTGQPASLCDRFSQWIQDQTQAGIQNALAPQAVVPVENNAP